MRKLFLTFTLLLSFTFAQSQLRFDNIDSVKLILTKAIEDSSRLQLYAHLGFTYAFLQVDSAIAYSQKAISLARKIQSKEGEANAIFSYGWALWASGNYDKAIDAALKSLKLQKDLKNYEKMASSYSQLAVLYRDAGDFEHALKYGMQSKYLLDSLTVFHEFKVVQPFATIGSIYLFLDNLDSASYYIIKSYEHEKLKPDDVSGYATDMMGILEARKKNYSKALEYYHSVIPNAIINRNYFDVVDTYFSIAQLYQDMGNLDSSVWYAKEILSNPTYSIFPAGALQALTILAKDYKLKNNNDSALKYLEMRVALNDSMFTKEKSRAIQAFTFNEALQQQELEASRIQNQNKVKLYAVFSLSGLFLLIGIILYRNNKVKQKANLLLQLQKEKVESALTALKSTQAQLVHSEKMASLGELTAGIAHEIQNPLNFVNNFSEVNTELIEELEEAADKGNLDELKSIAKDIRENEQKINHHGKRADSIVKGMLQHSRTSTNKKEPVDLNALTDEYLRLAYHGVRAKNKDFNVSMTTHFDQSVDLVQVVPQDIGRVLLNLYNNAFYAGYEKKKLDPNGYEPTVFVGTKKSGNKVEIRIKDNGTGIPQKIIDKIFQPFFTTKPTGEGTGLGLSLSYDIIKVHDGDIKVDTKENEFTEFTITLPA
jgi:signal transduction histidine kinase